jgi:RNA polymerase sigma-70 factor, ECF subfamily
MDDPGRGVRVDEDLDDTDLLILSRRRPEAFTGFYQRHAEPILRFFVRRTLDPETAAELTAETFAEAFASRMRFRDRGLGAEGWLYTIARRQLFRFYRSGQVEAKAQRALGMPEREVSPEDYERIEELIDSEGARSEIAEAFERLSPDQREAMRLRVLEGRPYAEVAGRLACTEQAARARVSRGLQRLAALLERAGEARPTGMERT